MAEVVRLNLDALDHEDGDHERFQIAITYSDNWCPREMSSHAGGSHRERCSENTDAFAWLETDPGEYGFRLSYPEAKR